MTEPARLIQTTEQPSLRPDLLPISSYSEFAFDATYDDSLCLILNRLGWAG